MPEIRPDPAADELFASAFEGLGELGGFVEDFGIVVPGDGLPVMLQEHSDRLYLAKCTRLDCADGATRDIVARKGANQPEASLAVGSDGLPILVYYDGQVSALKFDRCNDMTCEDRSTEILGVGEFEYASLTVAGDGLPMMVYFDRTNVTQSVRPSLTFLKCEDLSCSETTAATTLDALFTARATLRLSDEGLPVVSYVRTIVGSTNSFSIVVASCDEPDCSNEIRRETVDLGPLFVTGANNFSTLVSSLTMVVPPNSPPVLLGVAQLAGNGSNRLVTVACNTNACDDAEDPEIIGVNIGDYQPGRVDATVSADDLPAVVAVPTNGVAFEFVQCQTADCSEVTNRTVTTAEFGGIPEPKIAVAADGNPIIMGYQYRGPSVPGAARIGYCRDPECQSVARY